MIFNHAMIDLLMIFDHALYYYYTQSPYLHFSLDRACIAHYRLAKIYAQPPQFTCRCTYQTIWAPSYQQRGSLNKSIILWGRSACNLTRGPDPRYRGADRAGVEIEIGIGIKLESNRNRIGIVRTPDRVLLVGGASGGRKTLLTGQLQPPLMGIGQKPQAAD
jgi:hypothetical protein